MPETYMAMPCNEIENNSALFICIRLIKIQNTILYGSKQRHGNTCSQRDPARAAGDDRGKAESVHRSVDRGGGDAAFNQQPHPSTRHQGDAGGRQGRPGASDRQVKKIPKGFGNL